MALGLALQSIGGQFERALVGGILGELKERLSDFNDVGRAADTDERIADGVPEPLFGAVKRSSFAQ
ncbi:MAG TPA: hypothetical protein VEJ38_07755 [Candidatus Acidoferrales bacterium]|nr:hypothetical protein [Candidatus Acidoferrales bacterium]